MPSWPGALACWPVLFGVALPPAGLAANPLVPTEPLVRTGRPLVGGARPGELTPGQPQRLAADRIRPPDPTLTTSDPSSGFTETDVWNPDGSFSGGTDPVSWLLGLQTSVYDDVCNPPPS